MKLKKFAAALSAFVMAMCCVSCDKNKEKDTDTQLPVVSNGSVSDIITPEEGSEEYELGNYRVSGNNIKLYYEDEIPTELMLALEEYFLTIQNEDYDGYISALFPDYVERYSKYLEEQYSDTIEGSDTYTMKNSFEAQCANVRQILIDSLMYESDTDEEFTGDFKITRIRGERPFLEEGETLDDRIDSFFDYLKEIFGTDYRDYVEKNSDGIECLTFYVIAEDETGEEIKIVNDMNIFFAKKDGKYYTFG